jgi:hypothetical protein
MLLSVMEEEMEMMSDLWWVMSDEWFVMSDAHRGANSGLFVEFAQHSTNFE